MLKGKTVIITGGSRGIGKATALAFVKQGCNIAICGKNKKHLESAEKELNSKNVLAVVCDVSKAEDQKKFISSVKKKFGSIDILVNNAGVLFYKDLKDTTEEEINSMISTNVSGLILMAKQALPQMSKDGIIVNIASGAGKRGYGGLAVYCATKFAVIGFTESLAQEIKQKIVAICPGGVDTEMYGVMSSNRPSLKPEHIASKILEICEEPDKFKSGSAVEVYHVTDILNHLRLRYFKQN